MSIYSFTGFFQTDAIVYTELRWAYDHRELLFHWQNNHNKEQTVTDQYLGYIRRGT